jgi:enoyl-CoA hydratase
MLSELNSAFDEAAGDETIRVIVLAAEGKHFSSGHDLAAPEPNMEDFPTVGTQCHFDADGTEGYMAREAEMYLGLCWRWRNLAKPTIAQVQGKVIAGGLMLVWPMDLIVAFNVNGVEYFAHPFEAGTRLAKEMLFTGRSLTADELMDRGMVNKVVPLAELEEATLELAVHIAKRPMFGLTLAKQSVNQAVDAMGMYSALQAAFSLHHVGHSHNMEVHGRRIDPSGIDVIRSEA